MTNNLVSEFGGLRDLLRAISASIRQDHACDVVGVWLPMQRALQLRDNSLRTSRESNGFFQEDVLQPVEDTELVMYSRLASLLS